MANLQMNANKDVATILSEDGRVLPSDIGSIIWSHWHCDHSGDPSTFPPSVDLVVGPGFKDAFLPGYPTNPNGLILESDYAGRQLQEIDFTNGPRIGGFRAIDLFGDESFYLLDAPGNATGHMCGLARTTPSTFIFMGADACHHCGSLRPSPHHPLPGTLTPSPFSIPAHQPGTSCRKALLEAIHPKHSPTQPFYSQLSEAPGRDVPVAESTIQNMMAFDACEDVLVVLAHDKSLLGVVDLFPTEVNEWKRKGWKEAGRWRFLRDFTDAACNVSVS